MKKIATTVSVLAALVIGFLVLRGGEGTTPVAPPAVDARTEEEAPDSLDSLTAPETPIPERGEAGDEVVAPPTPRPFEPSLAEGIDVLVVDGASDVGVPSAEVFYAGEAELSHAQPEADSMLAAFDAMMSRHGRRFRTDEAGRVTVPEAEGLVVARIPESWGMAHVTPQAEEPARLELHPDRTLRVRVVDEQGEPCPNVSVALLFGRGRGDGARAKSRAPDGIAEFQRVLAVASVFGGAEARVAVTMDLSTPVEAKVDLDDLPAEPIELIMPSMGFLEVSVVTTDDASSDQPTRLSIEPVDYEREAELEKMDAARREMERMRRGCQHPIRFPYRARGARPGLRRRGDRQERLRHGPRASAGPVAGGRNGSRGAAHGTTRARAGRPCPRS